MARKKKKTKKPLNYTVKPHHWEGLRPDPKKYKGFVYEIYNLLTGQVYIGRKLMWFHSKGKQTTQTPWGSYTGSSKKLNDDIKKLGIENFKFKIVKQYKTKSGLRYGEVERIVKLDALTKNSDVYYNGSCDKCYSPIEYFVGNKRVEVGK